MIWSSISAQIITTFSFGKLFLTISVYLLPFVTLSSSTLQTIIFGFWLSNPI